MSSYIVTIEALGYETLVKTVLADSLTQARRLHGEMAMREWLELNDIDRDCERLAFINWRKD